jgi:hypothetical protein
MAGSSDELGSKTRNIEPILTLVTVLDTQSLVSVDPLNSCKCVCWGGGRMGGVLALHPGLNSDEHVLYSSNANTPCRTRTQEHEYICHDVVPRKKLEKWPQTEQEASGPASSSSPSNHQPCE